MGKNLVRKTLKGFIRALKRRNWDRGHVDGEPWVLLGKLGARISGIR